MTEQISPREYGKLEAEVRHLQEAVTSMQADIRAMRDLLEQSKGGWRTLVYLGGAAAALGSAVTWLFNNLHVKVG